MTELNARTYRILMVVVVTATGALTAIGINRGVSYLPVITLIVGALALQFLRRRTDEILYDERVTIINQKASAAALAVYTVGVTALGGILITLGRNTNPAYEQLGSTLAYLGCALLILRMVFHYYYSWRYGG